MNQGERQVAPTIDGIRRDHVARYEWAAAMIGSDKTVADAACGVGYGSQILVQAGNAVGAYDSDAEALGYAAKHYPGPTYWQRDLENPQHGEDMRGYDAAVCFETIEHLHDPAPLLRQLRQAAPLLLASVPNEDVFPWNNHAFHYRHYTSGEFQTLLEACGWEVTEWYGQRDAQSEIEKNINGRTLIAVCRRREKRAAPQPPATVELTVGRERALPGSWPERVAILGLGPSVKEYLELVKRAGGKAAHYDEVWGINAIGDVINCDRWFHMDDVRIQEIRARARPQSNIAQMLQWLRRHPGPILTSRAHPDYPGLVDFPLSDVVNSTRFPYFNSTAAYAVAYAVHLHIVSDGKAVKRLVVYGNDFTYPNAHDAEKGRGCVEFWLGYAAARGIKLKIPRTSSLMDACHSPDERLYGYDTVKIVLQDTGERFDVSAFERTELPTADEIEVRYDHSAHPNPLVRA